MKRISLSLYLIFVISSFIVNTNYSRCEVGQEINQLTIAVVLPESTSQGDLNATHIETIKSKLIQILTNYGITSVDYDNSFVIYPTFSILNSYETESGLVNLTVIKLEVSFFIKQIESNLIFASFSKVLTGNGKNKSLALTNAINNLKTNDLDFRTFLENGKKRILDYYKSNCSQILSKAENLRNLKKYEEAIALLSSVPSESSECFNKVKNSMLGYYNDYLNNQCSSIIQLAKTKIAQNEYSDALELLSQITDGTKCFKESQNLISSVEKKISSEEKQKWDMEQKKYNDQVNLEKLRINAIKEISNSYYKSLQKKINYNIIIK